MRWVRRSLIAVLILVGLGLAAVGAAGIWLDARFDDGRQAEAVVALSERERLDVEVPTPAGDGTFTRAVIWADGGARGIGDSVEVEIVESPKGWARIAGDHRLSSYGRWLLSGGAGLVLMTIAATVLAASRRKRTRAGSELALGGTRSDAPSSIAGNDGDDRRASPVRMRLRRLQA